MEDQFASNKTTAASAPNIRELFFRYIRFLPYFILSVALTLLGAYGYLRYSTPYYQSDAALLVKGSNVTESGGNDRFSQLFVLDNSINIQSEIELLKSRQLMERVVEKLNLNYQYHTRGKIDEVHHFRDVPFMVQTIALRDSAAPFGFEVVFTGNSTFRLGSDPRIRHYGEVFSLPQGRFALVPVPGGSLSEVYKIDWLPTSRLAATLASAVQVAPKGGTGILNLALQTTHPQLAADVLNQLMREYQVATIEDKNETKRQTIAFVDDRLEVVSRELDSLTAMLLNYQKESKLIDPANQAAAYLTRIGAIDIEAREQEAQLSIARMIGDYLADSRNNFSVVPSSLGLADGTLNTMISAYNAAQMERKGLVDGQVPEANPRVLYITSQIEELRLNILESLRNLRNAYQATNNRIRSERTQVQDQVVQLPVKEQNLVELKRQQEMKQAVYRILMEKREESAISLAATISNIKVVEPAGVNRTPVKPDRRSIKLLAVLVGLAIPAAVIVLRELLNDKVNSRADIEKLTAVPVLAEVGHSYADDTLVARTNNRGMVAEQFRILRSNLQYLVAGMDKPVVLVTSSFSGEGKSFVSTNLGAVLALAGKKTIILEFDIRKPKVLTGLGMGRQPGLTNWLLGKIQMEELPLPVPGTDNLWVLPCGPVPPNPAELLLHPKMETLFAWLREQFDTVVIDTAPVGIVSDALTLTRFANATLYITRQGHTYKKQVELIDDFAAQGKLPQLAIVLNDVQLETGYGFYGYGRYGYGYGQKAGYFEEEKTAPPNSRMKWLRKPKG